MQNLSQIGPVVWSVEGGAIDLAPAHLLLRAHLYTRSGRCGMGDLVPGLFECIAERHF